MAVNKSVIILECTKEVSHEDGCTAVIYGLTGRRAAISRSRDQSKIMAAGRVRPKKKSQHNLSSQITSGKKYLNFDIDNN